MWNSVSYDWNVQYRKGFASVEPTGRRVERQEVETLLQNMCYQGKRGVGDC